MKHNIYILTLVAALLTGCASDDLPSGSHDGNAISFSVGTKATTRADKTGGDAAELLGNNFIVYGVKGDGRDLVFDHYNVNWGDNTAGSTASNSSCWEYVGQALNGLQTVAQSQTIKYWDFAASKYEFVAFSAGGNEVTFTAVKPGNIGNDGVTAGKTEAVYTASGTIGNLLGAYVADLLVVPPTDYAKHPVTPKFRNLSSKVRMAIYETIPGYSVKDVKFYSGTAFNTTSTTPTFYTTGSYYFANPDGNGTMNVFFPDADDAHKAFVKFVPKTGDDMVTSMNFGDLDYHTGKEQSEAGGDIYLGRASNDATFADYESVLPLGRNQVLNIRVDYTLVSTDGKGEIIQVKDVWAQVPAEFCNWQPGFAYTYLFKITEQGGGLYPISFDAAEIIDGTPVETDTENSNPNITTYQNGINVSENDEYVAGNAPDPATHIYLVVGNYNTLSIKASSSTDPDAVGNIRLFTVEVDEGALQGITEASVGNCFVNGTKDTTNKTYTVTDYNGKKLVLTDVTYTAPLGVVNQVPGNASAHTNGYATFCPAAGKVYAFQYCTYSSETDGNKYVYKVIRVE